MHQDKNMFLPTLNYVQRVKKITKEAYKVPYFINLQEIMKAQVWKFIKLVEITRN